MAFLKQEAPEFGADTTPEEKISRLADFITQHMEELNFVLRHLSGDNFTESAWKDIRGAAEKEPAKSMVKLWENPEPASRMGRTDITIPGLSKYDIIGAAFSWAASNPYSKDKFIQFTPYEDGAYMRAVHIYHDANGDEICTRVVVMSGDTAGIGLAIDETGDDSDFWVIPLAIYGIKL